MTRKNLITIHPGEFLAEALGELGLNLQADHDLKVAGTKIGPPLRSIHSVTHAEVVAARTEATPPAPPFP
jgi:hypothetical protein